MSLEELCMNLFYYFLLFIYLYYLLFFNYIKYLFIYLDDSLRSKDAERTLVKDSMHEIEVRYFNYRKKVFI